MFYVNSEDKILDRALKSAEYIVENNCSLRNASENLLIPKSTIWDDIKKRLRFYNVELYDQVVTILKFNWSNRIKRMNAARRYKR